jgi:predicted O-methyltransferase YrrM
MSRNIASKMDLSQFPDLAHALSVGRPYFGLDMAAAQGPSIRKGYMRAIVELAVREKPKAPIHVLEVGSWAGASTITWARAIQEFASAGKVTCVDLWKPYFDLKVNDAPVYQTMEQAAVNGAIYHLFLHNIKAAGVDGILEHLIGDSRLILPSLPTKSFDIVFIDGSHVYEDVLADIVNAKPLVRDGGILCGDDLELGRAEVNQDNHELLLRTSKDYARDSRTGREYHPGVTEAIANEFDTVANFDGLWAVRRRKTSWEPVDLSSFRIETPPDLQSFDESQTTVAESPAPQLIGSYADFNLVGHGGQVFAIDQAIGEVDVTQGAAALVERHGADHVIVAQTAEGAQAQLEARALARRLEELQAEQRAQAEARARVDRLGSHGTYNLVGHGGRVFAIDQALGEVDVTQGAEALVGRYGADHVIVAQTAEGAQARLEARALARRLEELEADGVRAKVELKDLQAEVVRMREILGKIQSNLNATALQRFRRRLSRQRLRPES